MIDGVTTEAEYTALRSSGQASKVYIAGLKKPRIVFKARINQTFTSLDRVGVLTYDTVTYGSYTDVRPGMTVWIGNSEGGYEAGRARARKAPTSDTLYIGTTSQIPFLDNQYITVVDEYLIWPKVVYVDSTGENLVDHDLEYGDQHTVFYPQINMGGNWVVPLEAQPAATIEATNSIITYSGTWGTSGTDKQSETASNYAELDFYGSSISLSCLTGTFSGIATVTVDGYLAATVDLYSATGGYATVYSTTSLTEESHTIRVTVNGTKNPLSAWHWVTIDSFTCSTLEATIEPDASDSWCFGETVDTYEWTAPRCLSITDDTTTSPTIKYNVEGDYHITCEGTATKSSTGVRKVYVVNPSTARPASLSAQPAGSLDDGGWSFGVQVYYDATQDYITDGCHVALWSKDWYNGVKGSIGFEAGRENVIVEGWVDGETIDIDYRGGTVSFTVRGANYWLDKITIPAIAYDLAANTPNKWTSIEAMTVDRAVWSLLYERSTLTEIADVRMTGDTRLIKRAESNEASIWGAAQNFAEQKIISLQYVDEHGRYFLMIEPLAVPVADRADWPVVYEFDNRDLENGFTADRLQVNDTSQIKMTGRYCSSDGRERTFYALAFGHTHGTHGNPFETDSLAVDSQAQINQIAGLINGWRNNDYPGVELPIPANHRVVGLAPHQFIHLSVGANENIRGEELTFNMVPRAKRYNIGTDGSIDTVIIADKETGQTNCTDGDIPNVGDDLSDPPITTFPPIPPIDTGEDKELPPKKILIMEATRGLLYTENGDAEDPADIQWEFVNAGLADSIYRTKMTEILVTAYGKVYLVYKDELSGTYNEIWCAPAAGSAFTKVIDNQWLRDAVSAESGKDVRIIAAGINSLGDDQVAFYGGEVNGPPSWIRGGLFVGNSSGFTQGPETLEEDYVNGNIQGSLSFGAGRWSLTAFYKGTLSGNAIWNFATNGAMVGHKENYGDSSSPQPYHNRAGSSDVLYAYGWDRFYRATGNGGPFTETGGGIYPSPVGNASWQFDIDPTSRYLMLASSGLGYKSTDYAATWSSMGYALPLGISAFGWAKYDVGRWVAAGGAVYFTSDTGDTWLDISGNLAYVCPLPNIKYIKVIE